MTEPEEKSAEPVQQEVAKTETESAEQRAGTTLEEWLSQFKNFKTVFETEHCIYQEVDHVDFPEKFLLKKLKVKSFGNSEDAEVIKALFDYEVHILSKFNHINVVQYSSHYIKEDGRYLVLQNVYLDNMLHQQPAPKTTKQQMQAVELCIHICRAIESLHAHQTSCGNLDPFNIAIHQQAIVFDLISTRIPKPREHRYSVPIFDPSVFNPQVDLYSLGHILAFLMTGEHPSDKRFMPGLELKAHDNCVSVFEDLTNKKIKDATIAKFRLYSLYNDIADDGKYMFVTKPDALQKLEDYRMSLIESGTEEDKETLESLLNLRWDNHLREDAYYRSLTPEQQLEWNAINASREAVSRNQFEEAMKVMMPFAKDGCAWAENNVGILYEAGCGVEKNERIAQAWYLRAAEQDSLTAQENLAVLLQKEFVRDDETAFYWMSKAAKLRLAAGNNEATYLVGLTYDWTESWEKHQGTKRGRAEGRTRYPFQDENP